MRSTEPPDALLLHPSTEGLVPQVVLLAAFLVFELYFSLTGQFPTWLAIAAPAVFVVGLSVALVTLLRSRGAPWQLRCTTDGVQARGFDLVPWSALAEVRVDPCQPRWLYFFTWDRHRVISFIPREPGTVPATVVFNALPIRTTSSSRTARQRTKFHGSPFTVLTSTVDATPAHIADAIRRLTDVPVSGHVPG
ncbi:hypothetical protein [Amycolatopsis sp. PS_44_ISF1]|uniref:hypothetical protein n=1 Tax=Amycolatopsis sp. PS_44_ISF1 TaxID=2974917 RepID=UPI0028DD46E1|nr:hypothetical protein [Amycolatopsis sp. PS_44_ISF1]MDT8913535.1 hypothetical protein [Amycolatopsis sp. PS_44_ISF1]